MCFYCNVFLFAGGYTNVYNQCRDKKQGVHDNTIAKMGEPSGPADSQTFRLHPLRVEVLPLQEGGDPPWGEAVTPRLDAGRLQVPEHVGEEVIPVGGRRGEGRRLADRGVVVSIFE